MTGVAELIRSAVENVVRNAVRHTAPGTAVEVTIERQQASALLRVRDYGPGVPVEMLEKIFLPFHRNGHEGEQVWVWRLQIAWCECITAQSKPITHEKVDSSSTSTFH